MELRSRSRSKTPFFGESQSASYQEASVSSSKSVKKSFSTTVSTMSRVSTRRSSKLQKAALATSDYSSEEGDYYHSSHISENEKNQLIQDARAAANGTSEISALNLYRKAGRYWDKYPKTDWTYSPHSRDRVELAPGVVQMPNMSRPSIHCATNTDASYFENFNVQNVRQRLFNSTTNNNEEQFYLKSELLHKQQTRSVFQAVYTTILMWIYTVHDVLNVFTLSVMKQVHRFVSRVMLLDTWLMRKFSTRKRSGILIGLCLLPLILFGAFSLLNVLSSAAMVYYNTPSVVREDVPPKEVVNEQIDMEAIVQKIMSKIKQAQSNENGQENQVEMLSNMIAQLQEETARLKMDQQSKFEEYERLVSSYHSENIRNYAFFNQKLAKCCNQNRLNLEPIIAKVLSEALNDPDFLSKQKGFNQYLNSIYLTQNILEMRLANLTSKFDGKYQDKVDATAEMVFNRVLMQLKTKTSHVANGNFSEEEITRLIAKSLKIFDADKTGLVDYAMEPLGGQVVTTRCTETYSTGGVLSIWGLPLWNVVATPRVAITPGLVPGECWAFQNFPGFLVIKLAYRIRIDAFSMEHVSPLLVPDGKRDSAPKDFQVFGIEGEDDKNAVKIGEYQYDINGETIQYFDAQVANLVYSFIELRIESNHGNPLYTCLYRFRVHGKVV